MSTVQLEVLLKEAMEEEKKEVERIRKKYKQRIKELQNQKYTITIDQEKQALIEQAQKQEKQEKEQLRQKYKQRQKQNTTQPTNNPEKQALIEQAQKQEKQEKEQLRQKYKQRQKQNTTNPEIEDPHEEIIIKELPEKNEDLMENKEIKKLFEESRPYKEDKYEDSLPSNHDELYNIFDPQNDYEKNGELETVDRTELLEKYNIKDVHEDDIDYILESFDSPLIEEDIEKIEEKLINSIETSALSHPKIEWVNVLVFLDTELEGNIKIFAEYADRRLLKHIISKNNEELKVELIQIALYEVWDVFTTLGVNIDNLESKVDVEVELNPT